MTRNILIKSRRAFARIVAADPTSIRFCWKEYPDSYDPELEDTWTEGVENEVTRDGLMHTISPERIVQRGNTEIEIGDAIIDMPYDAFDPEGKSDIRICIADKWWGSKSVNGELAASWDAVIGGEGVSKTFLISPLK